MNSTIRPAHSPFITTRRRFQVIWLLGALAFTAEARAQIMTDVEEIKMGRQIAQQAEEWWGVLPPNHPMSRRVQHIGGAISRFSVRRGIPYSYKVLDNDEILNAFAAPGGPVYVTKRLMRFTTNDAELASILGHEIAHIDRRHMARRLEKRRNAQRTAGAWRERILGKGVGDEAVSVAADIGFVFWSLGYSRENEREADKWGARWMSRLGFDPRASISVITKLQSKHNPSGFARYLSTHPVPEERLKTLRQLISSEKLLDVARLSGGPALWASDKVSTSKQKSKAIRTKAVPAVGARPK